MKLTEIQQKKITEKNKMLNNIKPILKLEFIGIDNVIDDVVDAIRPFYIFPESLKRPLVVNLWGLTATGKSHLVERIVDLLDLRNRFVRFDVGEYTGTDYRLRSDLSGEVSKLHQKDVVISFDEFQFGRTLNAAGSEIASNAMRPVWDLLDSGKIYKWGDKSNKPIWDIIRYLEELIKFDFDIKNGVVMNKLKEYNRIFKNYSLMPCDYAEVNAIKLSVYSDIPGELKKSNKKITKKPIVKSSLNLKKRKNLPPTEFWYSAIDLLKNFPQNFSDDDNIISGHYSNNSHNLNVFKQPYLLKYSFLQNLYDLNPDFFNNNSTILNLRTVFDERIKNLVIEEVIELLKKEFWRNTTIMTADDYSQSLIFCIGNIDEAYHMHDSSDPDADADIFYENSLKITIPKMKAALSQRFRMEQIGRLGNNHIIYPAFNVDSYKKIINKHINIRKKTFDEDFGINIEFDNSVHNIVYKEGVFPSQGVRPLLSTLNTMLDSYVSKIISDIILNYPIAKDVIWKFDVKKEKYIIDVLNEKKKIVKSFKYDVKLNIDKLRKSDFSERQAYTALHEAGHAVVACVKAQLIPKEIVSKTAGVAEGFCRTEWPDIDTKELMYKQIMVALGGIEAEKLIFGNDFMSNGTGSDLSKATTIASLMVKYYGMSNHNYHLAVAISPGNEYNTIHDTDNKIEEEVKNILDKAQKDVHQCLKDNKLFLLETAQYLSNNSKLVQDEFKPIVLKYLKPEEIKDKDNYYAFKNTLQILRDEEEAKLKNKQHRYTSSVAENIQAKSYVLNKDNSIKK